LGFEKKRRKKARREDKDVESGGEATTLVVDEGNATIISLRYTLQLR
jgi:hypothetical protein